MLHELIEAHNTGDPDESARLVLDAMQCPRKWADEFFSLVRDECRRQYRSGTRGLESVSPAATIDNATPIPRPSRRADYLASRLWCGGERGYILRGAMTIDDHEVRIAYLDSLRAGITRTVESHRRDIDTIKTAGVSCLFDLDAEAAA